jgi:hypothetical protein
LDTAQFNELIAANVKALNGYEMHHAGMSADGRLND